MWCVNCKTEHSGDKAVCPLCGQALTPKQSEPKAIWGRCLPSDKPKNWPVSPDGEPESPAFLAHCTCLDMDDEILLNMLSAYGIPAFRYYPGDGGFGKVVLGMSSSGADIYVPQSLFADAQALMGGISDE